MITSESTYRDLRQEGALGEMQAAVLSLIRLNPAHTARELARAGGYDDPNCVRPRIHELNEIGKIEAAGVRLCTVTGRAATTWRIKRYEPQRELFE